MALNKEALQLARERKAQEIYFKLEAEQLKSIWNASYVSAIFILVLLAGSSALNWRSFHFLLTIGERISSEIAGWISVPLAAGLGWALFQQSFKKALNHLKAADFKPSFKSIFLTWLYDRSISIAAVMVFGIFGALLFLWGETHKNEMEVAYAGEDINRIEAELEDLKIRYENDVASLERDIEFYRSLGRVKLEVVPRQTKIETLTNQYEEKRGKLRERLEQAREAKSKFRPTSFLSDIIGGVFWRRVLIIAFCAVLLSATVDLAQYSITTISVSRAFAFEWRSPDELSLMDIYNLFNGEKAAGDTANATQNATAGATPAKQPEGAENNGSGKILRINSAELTEIQSKMLQIIQEQVDRGADIGEINKSELARKCGVDRATIYRNWQEVLKYVVSKNGKYQHEEVA